MDDKQNIITGCILVRKRLLVNIMNVLFIQDSLPCMRNIKCADALGKAGISVHLLYKNKTKELTDKEEYRHYKSVTLFRNYRHILSLIKSLVKDNDISLIHYHNQPDTLCAKIINSGINIPILFDCHDFMSFKHRLSRNERNAERICNENAQGLIYPSKGYLREASKYYNFCSNTLVFMNYFPSSHLLHPDDFQAKLSSRDGLIHLVFQGRLAEKKSDHRYIVNQLKIFNPSLFRVHLFPNNHKGFKNYKMIESVVLHEKLPYDELIKTMSAMDYGLVIFQDTIKAKINAVRYAFGNKTFDYLCAGLPILAQDSLFEVKDFVIENRVGLLTSQKDKIPSLSKQSYENMCRNVLNIRDRYSMEHNIDKLISFYRTTLEKYNA